MSALSSWVAVALLAAGVLSMTVAVIGTLRRWDDFMRTQAAAKAMVPGLALILLASFGSGDGAIVRRAMLTLLFLLITATVSSHAIVLALRDDAIEPKE